MAALLLLLQEENNRRNLRRERIFRDRSNPLDTLTDNEILRNYRFTRQGIFHLINVFGNELEHPTNRNHSLTAQQQLLVTLRFYATGAPQHVFGELFGVERSSVSKVITRVTTIIQSKVRQHVSFPTAANEITTTKQSFYQLCGIPNVLGAIDCTHIRLYKAPLKDTEPLYVNRKHWHSINVQIVGDPEYKISNISARWPGCVHDNFVFRSSNIGMMLENNGDNGFGCLIGDSGYYQRSWMMTPYQAPVTNGQRMYNRAHRRGRVIIEQLNGQLKQKFPCLVYGLRVKPEKACLIIIACAMLYNISKSLNEPEFNDIPLDDLGNDVIAENVEDGRGLLQRDLFVQTYFG